MWGVACAMLPGELGLLQWRQLRTVGDVHEGIRGVFQSAGARASHRHLGTWPVSTAGLTITLDLCARRDLRRLGQVGSQTLRSHCA